MAVLVDTGVIMKIKHNLRRYFVIFILFIIANIFIDLVIYEKNIIIENIFLRSFIRTIETIVLIILLMKLVKVSPKKNAEKNTDENKQNTTN
jgi:hypothetical protein